MSKNKHDFLVAVRVRGQSQIFKFKNEIDREAFIEKIKKRSGYQCDYVKSVSTSPFKGRNSEK